MNAFNISNSFKLKKQRNWKQIYWMFDLHGTIIPSSYSNNVKGFLLYPHAEEVLRYLSKRDDCYLILWTSSYASEIEKFIAFAKTKEIIFNEINGNSAEPSNNLSDFSKKPYFNILIDDKAGFDPYHDWKVIGRELYKQVLAESWNLQPYQVDVLLVDQFDIKL